MARFSIYSADGSTVRYTGAPKYNGVFGKASYVEFSEISSPSPIPWEVGDYVTYSRTGLTYRLYNIPRGERRAASNRSGEAVVYKNVQFFAQTKELEICPFNDLVLGDNTVHFSSKAGVSTYEDVAGIARRIKANLDAFYPGNNWLIRCYEGDATVTARMAEVKEFSVQEGSCMTALDAIYNTWKGIGWVHTYENGYNCITIGRPNVQNSGNTTDLFVYGRGNGLTVLATSVSGQNGLATRVYAYGSERNMISRYYNNYYPAIKDNESVYIPNLMLPFSDWGTTDSKKDPDKAYLQASSDIVGKYGIRVKRLDFDGSGEYEEIYPSISGVTAKNLRDAMPSGEQYRPSASIYPDNARMDEVKGAVNPTDNGIVSDEAGGRYSAVETVQQTAQSTTVSLTGRMRSISTVILSGIAARTLTHSGRCELSSDVTGSVSAPAGKIASMKLVAEVYVGGMKVWEFDVPLSAASDEESDVFSFSIPSTTFKLGSAGAVSITLRANCTFASQTSSIQFATALSAGTFNYSFMQTYGDTFTMTIKQIGFDISKQQSSLGDGLCTVSMKSGNCAGRDFVVKSVKYNQASDDWTLVCMRQNDSSLGQYFPNSTYPIETGDAFVLVDLEMPEIYISSASQRLHDRALEVLNNLSVPKIVYDPSIDAKVIAESGEILLEGMYMQVGDSELIGSSPAFVLIDSVTIDEGGSNIPTYKVTLRDEKYENTIARLTGEIDRLNSQRRDALYDSARSQYRDTESTMTYPEPSVNVLSEGSIFAYPDGEAATPSSILLTAETESIAEPQYQWQYYADGTWRNITGATSQSYEVGPDNPQYFPSGDNVAEIRCLVNSSYASGTATISKILSSLATDGLSVMLSTPSRVFEADTIKAVPATDTIAVIGYRGVTRVATTIGTITDLPDGMTLVPEDNGTDHATLSLAVTAAMTSASGKVAIPVTVGDVTTTIYFAYALSFVGETGATGTDGISVFLSTTSAIAEMEQGGGRFATELFVIEGGIRKTTGMTIGTISPLPNEMEASVSGMNIYLDYSDHMAETSGEVTIPVTYKGQTYNLKYAWAIAQRGQNAEVYYITTDVDQITRDVNNGGVLSPALINVTTWRKIGSLNAVKYNPGRLRYCLNGTNWHSTTNSTLPLNISKSTVQGDVVMLQIANDSSGTILYATKNIPVVNTPESGYRLEVTHPIFTIPCNAEGQTLPGIEEQESEVTLYKGNTPQYTGVTYEYIGHTYVMANGLKYWYQGMDEYETYEGYPHWWLNIEGDSVYTPTATPASGSIYIDSLDGIEYHFAQGYKSALTGVTFSGIWVRMTTNVHIDTDVVNVAVIAKVDGDEVAKTTIVFSRQMKGAKGDTGLQGATPRGITDLDAELAEGRAFYNGIATSDFPEAYQFIDLGFHDDNGTIRYYKCKNSFLVEMGDTPWGDGTDWEEASYYEFLFAKLLFAQAAYIDILSGKSFRILDGNGNICAGIQGGTGVNVWVGGSNPNTAPFRAYNDGKIVATKGEFGTLEIRTNAIGYGYIYSKLDDEDFYDTEKYEMFLTPELLKFRGYLNGWDGIYNTIMLCPNYNPDRQDDPDYLGGLMSLKTTNGNAPALVTNGQILANGGKAVVSPDSDTTHTQVSKVVKCTSDNYPASPDANTVYDVGTGKYLLDISARINSTAISSNVHSQTGNSITSVSWSGSVCTINFAKAIDVTQVQITVVDSTSGRSYIANVLTTATSASSITVETRYATSGGTSGGACAFNLKVMKFL